MQGYHVARLAADLQEVVTQLDLHVRPLRGCLKHIDASLPVPLYSNAILSQASKGACNQQNFREMRRM